MKQSMNQLYLKHLIAGVVLSFLQIAAFAQDSSVETSKSNSSVTTTTTTWYAEPWVWALGAAVLIIIIIAITRGGGGGGTIDKVTYSKQVSREDS